MSVFIKEPFSEYLARGKTHMRSGPLGLFRESPYKYWAEREGILAKKDSTAYSFGRAVHSLILEGNEALLAEYTSIPEELRNINKNKKEYQDWKKAQTKYILDDSEVIALKRMQDNVKAHESAGGLLSEGVSENTVLGEWQGRPCQVRIDHFNNHIVDLKTTRNLDGFEYDARQFKYNNQMAFYRDVYASASDADFPPYVYIIAVEKIAPYRVGVWKLKDDWLELGHVENVRAMKELAVCEEFNNWPHGFEKMRELGFYEGRK